MGITDFVNWMKKESAYGTPGLNTDTPTSDILTSVNARRNRIWRKPGGWAWSVAQLAIPMTPGQVVYAVTPKTPGQGIDRINNLIPNDPTVSPPVAGRALVQRTERQFYDEIQGCSPTYKGIPTKYLNLGQVNGLWNVRVWPGPATAFTMGGSAKGILNTFLIGDVTGVAPFSPANVAQAANAPFDFWPNGVVEDILFEGVLSDIRFIQQRPQEAAALNASFEAKVKLLAAEEADAAKDNTPLTTKLPALVRRRMLSRRRGC